MAKMEAFNVYLNRDKNTPGKIIYPKLIDTVFFTEGTMTAEEVRESLINHDGYDYRIKVVKRK